MKTILRISFHYDHDVECPCDMESSWKLYSFCSRHTRFLHPDKVGEKFPNFEELREQGLAHVLSYHEHGLCQWGLYRQVWQDHWDTVNGAGILVWEDEPSDLGAKTVEERQESARLFLEEYTDWANGNCYGYSIDKFTVPDDFDGSLDDIEAANRLKLESPYKVAHLDSCFGFIGDSYMCDEIRQAIEAEGLRDYEVEYAGEADFIGEHNGFDPSDLAAQTDT